MVIDAANWRLAAYYADEGCDIEVLYYSTAAHSSIDYGTVGSSVTSIITKSIVIYERAFYFFIIFLLFFYFSAHFFCAFFSPPTSTGRVDQICLVWFHARMVISEPCLHITSKSTRLPYSTGILT